MRVSVIIPTYNEAARIGPLLAALRAQDERCDAIVVDGGSNDGTPRLAAASGWAEVLTTPPGRGAQLALGAATARGEVLLFLHADTVVPAGALAALRQALASQPDAIGGNFRLLFDGDTRFAAWLTGFYAWLRRHGWYYGDSGIFLRRDAYDAIGGLRPLAVMEDFDLVRRLECAGPTLCIDTPPLTTSSRRFAGRHPLAIIAGWLRLHALHALGTPSARLAELYDSRRTRQAAE